MKIDMIDDSEWKQMLIMTLKRPIRLCQRNYEQF